MQLTLEIDSPNELQLILQYLRFMPSVRVREEPKIEVFAMPVATPEKPKTDFSQYWGCLQTGLTLDEIDQKLNEMREEWTRDF